MQYAENRVTMQPTKEAFRATGASPLLFIPEGRTDSPPIGRWSPLTGPCALRGGISCLRTRPKGFPSSNIAGSFAFGNSLLGSRFCTMPFGNLRSLSLQRATGCAVICSNAIPPCALLSCHWQNICSMAHPATGSLRVRRGWATTKEVNDDGNLPYADESCEPG